MLVQEEQGTQEATVMEKRVMLQVQGLNRMQLLLPLLHPIHRPSDSPTRRKQREAHASEAHWGAPGATPLWEDR